jgi:hypothetical protein
VSGNGTGFVWHASDAQEQDVVERALIHEVEAGFIAVQQGEFGGTGMLAEGSGDAGEVVTGRMGGHGVGK